MAESPPRSAPASIRPVPSIRFFEGGMEIMKTAMFAALALISTVAGGPIVRAQVPGLPGSTPPPGAAPADSDTRSATRATSSGPIRIDQRVPDDVMRGFLARFLPQYPGVRT